MKVGLHIHIPYAALPIRLLLMFLVDLKRTGTEGLLAIGTVTGIDQELGPPEGVVEVVVVGDDSYFCLLSHFNLLGK